MLFVWQTMSDDRQIRGVHALCSCILDIAAVVASDFNQVLSSLKQTAMLLHCGNCCLSEGEDFDIHDPFSCLRRWASRVFSVVCRAVCWVAAATFKSGSNVGRL